MPPKRPRSWNKRNAVAELSYWAEKLKARATVLQRMAHDWRRQDGDPLKQEFKDSAAALKAAAEVLENRVFQKRLDYSAREGQGGET